MPERRPARIARRRTAAVRRLALAGLAAASWLATAPAPARAAESAVIFMYHRFGESVYPSTSISLKEFEAHIAELRKGGYTVLPVPEIVAALQSGRPLPERTIGLTVDDAYRSVYTEAWPRLKAAGLPVTLFVATDPVDERLADFMTWDQIREMAAGGATIGGHSASHLHMARTDAARNRAELQKSNARFVAELGKQPDLFAYPYGETSLAISDMVKKAGYRAAFGQHSGVADRYDNFFYLPRFALNEKYGNIERFRLAANALPLPATDMTPADPTVTGENPPPVGFTLVSPIKGLNQLACYGSHEGKVQVERLGEMRIEVRFRTALPRGRTRLNCTMPAGGGRWRWLGWQFFRP